MTLTLEQFKELRKNGLSVDQITRFDKGQAPPGLVDATQQRFPMMRKVQAETEKRPDALATLREEVKTPFDFKNKPFQSLMKPLVTGLKVAAIPFQRLESGIMTPLLHSQDPSNKVLPRILASEAMKGFSGKKVTRVGDPIRAIGDEGLGTKIAAGLADIAIPIAGANLLNKGLNAFKMINKMGDKRMLEAGNNLIKGSEQAVNQIGDKLNKAYTPVNSVKVVPDKVLNNFSDLPQPILTHIERELGTTIDDVLSDFTIEKARRLKGVLGELRPSSFGKGERGALELVTDKQINRAYASVKQSMQESLRTAGFGKQADSLLKADEAFSDTLGASNFIKKTIVESTLRKPTKVGSAALKMAKEGDLSARDALNTLKSASGKARSSINSAVMELERYNRLTGILKAGERFINAGVYGGAAGLVGGRILQGIQE